ncbi:MAG: hypothetical protein O3A10_10040 [Chloroflexi bacterium]|nr:hypothetical protein [Chloroflexota bacterium]MDA1147549.1 hypothetical protein [Chloroflexota bacterium]
MNRQLAVAYATTGVAAAVAAIITVGSAFGLGAGPTASVDTPASAANVLAAAAALPPAEGAQLLEQWRAAQAVVTSEVEAERAVALDLLAQQIAEQQQAAAADLQRWIDEQQRLAVQSSPAATSGDLLVLAWRGDDDERAERDEHEAHEGYETDEHRAELEFDD